MHFKLFMVFFVSHMLLYAGAGFESDSYLIWISSKCPERSQTCTDLTYIQTNKSNGKTITVKGAEPIVGTMSGNLIGYTFRDNQTKTSYELSMDLDSVYHLYVRFPRSIKKEELKQITEQMYQTKLSRIHKK